jgi:hypothetical protein
MVRVGNNQQNAAATAGVAETTVMATAIVAAWRQWRRWLWRMMGGGNSGGGIVGCGFGGGFCGSVDGGGELQDDRGMEEVVMWRLLMFV